MLRFVFIALVMVSLQGCAAAALTAAGVAGGAGVDHTLSGITYKTFTAPINDVRLATLKTLDRMDIKIAEDKKDDSGWAISATAADREIDIELEKLTERTTRMRVVANKGDLFFKDAATSTEIIIQTARTLDDFEARNKRPQKANR
jgi:hypothetical protein